MPMDDASVVEYQALSPDARGLGPDAVLVEWSPADCARLTDPRIEREIAATWERRLAANPRLFDGSKFRLHGPLLGVKPVFRLGLTSYRDYLGTNCGERTREVRRQGRELARGDPQAFMADPLGVGALMLTADRRVVLLRRSQWCGEAQGLVDGPGGHPEPKKVPGILDGSNDVDPSLVVKEIFESIVDEVVDEVNVPRSELSEPRLLGIIKNNTTGGRRSVQFIIKCRMSSSEIRESFDLETQSEAYESTAILFQTEDELLNEASPEDFAPQMRGGLSLYFHLKKQAKHSS